MQLVIFDCDGTIIDSQNVIIEAMNRAFVHLGLRPPGRQQVIGIVGLALPEAFEVLASDHDLAARVELAARYRAAFRDLSCDPAHSDPLYPGVRVAIETLAAEDDILLGIATGKSRRGVDHLLEREEWHDAFATIQTADEHPSKPNPSMILSALTETGCTRANTVMIGDTIFDMEMARAAGVHAIGAGWGYHAPDQLLRAGAHDVVLSAFALPQALGTILGEPLRFGPGEGLRTGSV